MAYTQEPQIARGDKPEDSLQQAIIEEAKEILGQIKASHSIVEYIILPKFGLDIAFFIRWHDCSSIRFLELRAYTGSRPGGIGFGNGKGEGTEVDLLRLDDSQINLADEFIRWILVDGTKPIGSKRFAIFNNSEAKNSAMGSVERGKQNNLRVSTLMPNAITWDDLSRELEFFLKP